MIEIVEGKIGSGKSYFAVKRILEVLAGGGTVYSNCDIDYKGAKRYCRYKYGVDIELDQVNPIPDDFYTWHEVLPFGTEDNQILVVIDEVHLFYNSRDWKETQKKHKGMVDFLSLTRKRHVDLIFITQVMGNIDKQIRTQAQFVWSIRDMKRVPIAGINFMLKNYIYYAQKDYENTILSKGFVRKSQMIFACYDSFGFITAEDKALAEKKRKHAIKKKQLMKLSLWQRFKIFIEVEIKGK